MTQPAANPLPPAPLFTEDEAQMRIELYSQQRVNYQDSFYRRRIAEFTFNSEKMLWASAFLMGISSVISTYSVLSNQAFFAFVTALLPAFATAISAFRALYQWQRQATVYEDSWLALQRARLAIPDEDFLQVGDYARFFPELVLQTETVLRAEASQWGQTDQGPVSATPSEPPAPSPAPASQPTRRRTSS